MGQTFDGLRFVGLAPEDRFDGVPVQSFVRHSAVCSAARCLGHILEPPKKRLRNSRMLRSSEYARFFCRSGDQPDIRSAPQPRRRPPSLHSIHCRGIGRRHQPRRPLAPDDAMYTTGYGSRHDARQPPQCRDPALSHHVQISSSLRSVRPSQEFKGPAVAKAAHVTAPDRDGKLSLAGGSTTAHRTTPYRNVAHG